MQASNKVEKIVRFEKMTIVREDKKRNRFNAKDKRRAASKNKRSNRYDD